MNTPFGEVKRWKYVQRASRFNRSGRMESWQLQSSSRKDGYKPYKMVRYKEENKKPSTLNICQLADIAELNVAETLF
jgi:hypothetical protein